jgi:cytochrome c oxidase assembly factor CtaG
MQLSFEAFVLVPLVALAYVLVTWRDRPSRGRAAAATAAFVLIFVAFVTELQALALHTFLWAHLLQNVVLAEWAPALVVLAVPPAIARRASGFVLFRPLVALPLWIVVYLTWHLPWAYDYALRHPHSLLHVEHVSYLAAGLVVWWPVIHGRYSAGAKALYMFAAFVLASPLGLVLALVPSPIYSFYENAPRTWGPSPLGDQQLAGVTMALEQAVVFAAVFAAFLRRFFEEEQLDGAFDELRRTSRAAAGSARPRR